MSRFTSYSACGIPFVVGGVVAGGVEALVARSPEEHRRRGIDVRTHHEATGIDLGAGEVEFLDQHAGTFGRLGFDQLMIATGGEPVRPGLPGIDLPLRARRPDARRRPNGMLALPPSEAAVPSSSWVAGYIGVEMAEAYVGGAPRPRGGDGHNDEAMKSRRSGLGRAGRRRRCGRRGHHADVASGSTASSPGACRRRGRRSRRPRAAGPGVRRGRDRGALRPASTLVRGAVSSTTGSDDRAEPVWVAGDCATTAHLYRAAGWITLGTYANKQSRSRHQHGRRRPFPGALGTAITRLSRRRSR